MTIDLHLASFIVATIFLRVEYLMTPLKQYEQADRLTEEGLPFLSCLVREVVSASLALWDNFGQTHSTDRKAWKVGESILPHCPCIHPDVMLYPQYAFHRSYHS